MLYCHSLLVPGIAARVHGLFADLLDTPTGQIAQLAAAARILSRAYRMGDYADLQHPIRLSRRLLQSVETTAEER